MRWISALMTAVIVFSSAASAQVRAPRIVQLTRYNTLAVDLDIGAAHVDIIVSAAIAKRLMLPNKETLYVFLISPGGNIYAAKGLSEMLNAIPGTQLVCVYCASAAGWVFEKSIHLRLIVYRSTIMMHEIRRQIRPSEMASFDVVDFLQSGVEFNQVFQERMSLSPDKYMEQIKDKDWTVAAPEMLTRNLADELIQVKCDREVKQMMPVTCSMSVQ